MCKIFKMTLYLQIIHISHLNDKVPDKRVLQNTQATSLNLDFSVQEFSELGATNKK